jgi:hypothetical protein
VHDPHKATVARNESDLGEWSGLTPETETSAIAR